MSVSRWIGFGLIAHGAALWLLWRSRHVPPIPGGYPDRVTAWQARYGHLSSWPSEWWSLVGWCARIAMLAGLGVVVWPILAVARWSWPALAVGVIIGICVGVNWARAQWLYRPEPRTVDIFFPDGPPREQLSPAAREEVL